MMAAEDVPSMAIIRESMEVIQESVAVDCQFRNAGGKKDDASSSSTTVIAIRVDVVFGRCFYIADEADAS